MLDKRAVVKTVTQYADVVKKEMSPFAIILFGSYAKGNARDESDIDVAVVFNDFTGDWLTTSSRLWHLAYDISWDLEPHLLDISQDKSGFAKHVFMTGEVIYQA